MKIDIITIFPELFLNIFEYGIISKATKNSILDIKIHDLRDYGVQSEDSRSKYKQVDDRPFGGGAGMVLRPEPLFEVIEKIKSESAEAKVIFLTPSGDLLKQSMVEDLSTETHLVLICGRYEGIDQRVIDELVDMQISIGEYVLSGGEFPAMVLVDSVVRLIPGVIKNSEFNDSESFSNKDDRTKLDFPQWTRPAEYKGLKVPDILLSGNHQEVAKWREEQRK